MTIIRRINPLREPIGLRQDMDRLVSGATAPAAEAVTQRDPEQVA